MFIEIGKYLDCTVLNSWVEQIYIDCTTI